MRFLVLLLLIVLSSSALAKLKVASYNIRNFDYDERSRVSTNKDHLFTTINQMSPDFMAVQEINRAQIFTRFIEKYFGKKYGVVLSKCGGAHGQKLGFVYNKTKFKLIGFKEDLRTSNPGQQHMQACNNGSRPLAIGKFMILDSREEMIAISVHLKSGGRPKSIAKRFQQLNIMNKVVQEYRATGIKNFIIAGDFNSTEYIFKGTNYNKFNFAVEKMGLVDLAKDVKCTSYWWGGIQDKMQHPSILDHMLVSPGLIEDKKLAKARPTAHCQKLSCQVTYEDSLGTSFDEVSDHCPIAAEL